MNVYVGFGNVSHQWVKDGEWGWRSRQRIHQIHLLGEPKNIFKQGKAISNMYFIKLTPFDRSVEVALEGSETGGKKTG